VIAPPPAPGAPGGPRRSALRYRAARALALAALAACEPSWDLPLIAEPAQTRADQDAELRAVEGSPVWTGAQPMRAGDCGPPCADRDGDGLADVWERALLRAARPTLWFHRDDGMFRDRRAALAMIGRVTPARVPGAGGRPGAGGGSDEKLLVTIVLAYSRDYGRCGGDSHPGDTERIALELTPLPDGRSVRAERWYTAAHEGTSYDASSRGHFFALEHHPALTWQWSLDAPPDSLFVARDKHATYPSLAACAGRRLTCVDDVCGAEVPLELPVWNAGEPDAPLLTSLDALGFPEQCVWCRQPFCGDGRDAAAGGCASPMADKLEHSAFSPVPAPPPPVDLPASP
jgi:hypothetical protein